MKRVYLITFFQDYSAEDHERIIEEIKKTKFHSRQPIHLAIILNITTTVEYILSKVNF